MKKKLIARIARKLKRVGSNSLCFSIDRFTSTYSNARGALADFQYFNLPDLSSYRDKNQVISLVALFAKHYFDLLGSGWVRVAHGINSLGVEGYNYSNYKPMSAKTLAHGVGRAYAASVRKMLSEGYQLIDWQLDFKSGYRWSEKTWYNHIPYGHKPGIDIKVPWELARMHHLVQFAFAYQLDSDNASVYQREFSDQVLDFIAHNPPRFGVNWRCAMDVGIRVANWLVSYDLFQAAGALFDTQFEQVFLNSVYDHGKHIINNLEWYAESIPRSNHYLADVVGLLFVSAYLPRSEEIDAWLAFSVQELIKEVQCQFHPEGSNVEGSTSYHRLSAEMVIYATALVLGLPEEKRAALEDHDSRLVRRLQDGALSFHTIPGSKLKSPFPAWYFDRLERMAEFTMAVTKPSGVIAQVGDNDSGRFLKLFPAMEKISVRQAKQRYAQLEHYDALSDEAGYWDEQGLDHHHLVAAINGLFDRDDFSEFAKDYVLETEVVRGLAKGVRVGSQQLSAERAVVKKETSVQGLQLCHHYEFASDLNLQAGLKQYYYPDFGLLVFNSPNCYCHLRLAGKKYGGNGHRHCDQLSVELELDGRSVLQDKGTYLYTPVLKLRNQYRACTAHNGPRLKGHECNHINQSNPFHFARPLETEIGCNGDHCFTAKLTLGAVTVYRKLSILPQKIVIEDLTESRHNDAPELAEMLSLDAEMSFSSGYGKRE